MAFGFAWGAADGPVATGNAPAESAEQAAIKTTAMKGGILIAALYADKLLENKDNYANAIQDYCIFGVCWVH
jgi:hypothetical protein